jgi:hypothetical protein
LFDNEFNCEFLTSAGGLFDPVALQQMFGGVSPTDWAERLASPAAEGLDVVKGAEAVLW